MKHLIVLPLISVLNSDHFNLFILEVADLKRPSAPNRDFLVRPTSGELLPHYFPQPLVN